MDFEPMERYEEDDEVEEVRVQDVPKKRYANRVEKKNWTSEEEEALAKAWIHISTCKVVGNEQSRDRFWERVLEHFSSIMGGTTRTHNGLNTKWTAMNGAIAMFNGLYIQSV